MTEKNESISRRSFLFKTLNLASTVAVANVGVYVVGSAFKNLDGSFVAGAKFSLKSGGTPSADCDTFPNQCSGAVFDDPCGSVAVGDVCCTHNYGIYPRYFLLQCR